MQRFYDGQSVAGIEPIREGLSVVIAIGMTEGRRNDRHLGATTGGQSRVMEPRR